MALKTKTVAQLKASEQSKKTIALAQNELKEFVEKYKALCNEYNCRFEAQVTINAGGIKPELVPVHNLFA